MNNYYWDTFTSLKGSFSTISATGLIPLGQDGGHNHVSSTNICYYRVLFSPYPGLLEEGQGKENISLFP